MVKFRLKVHLLCFFLSFQLADKFDFEVVPGESFGVECCLDVAIQLVLVVSPLLLFSVRHQRPDIALKGELFTSVFFCGMMQRLEIGPVLVHEVGFCLLQTVRLFLDDLE